MDLAHRFSVPTPVEETWAHFQDIASVAECFPGAQVSSAEGDSFSGSVKVKLGPIALVYNGSGTFVEKDDTAHRFVVDAKGKDKRGNGTAGAKVTLSMDTSASGGTDVEVLTDLAVTGKPAQFGRGVMQDVSDKLLGQFVACLEERLGSPAVAPAAEAPIVPDEVVGDSGVSPAGTSGTVPAAEPEVEPEPEPVRPAVPRHVSPPTSPTAPAAPTAPPAPTASPARADDAINLGSTVLPILFKNYWKQGLGALAVIALIVILIAAL
jgi:carbon monoxide dehydrogenase subunit G